jgi:hypothetical protein
METCKINAVLKKNISLKIMQQLFNILNYLMVANIEDSLFFIDVCFHKKRLFCQICQYVN